MTNLTSERPLAEDLKRRIEIERRNAANGHIYRSSSFLLKYEEEFTRPLLKLGLKIAGLYRKGMRNALSPVVRTIRLPFDNLPEELDGFRILHLSDLHIDGVDGLAEVLAGMLSDLDADVCLMTGDYRFETYGPCDRVYPRMEMVVSSLSPRHGVFGILGNHDASEIAFALEDMGVSMLINRATELRVAGESLWLIGVDDPHDYQCHDLESALASVPEDGFKILLAHTPQLYGEASDAGIHLYLCGHTHAGQVQLPGIGSLIQNVPAPKAYTQGHWNHGNMRGYTSAGLGCSMLPIRFNCPPEIVVIELAVGST
jgi:predicted MPP superfamily phosphohydrolase